VTGPAGEGHGTAGPSRSHRSSTAGYRLWPVAQHHNSRALPLAPQPKQCHTPRPRCAEKERLRGELAPCNGHGPRTWSPRRSRGCQPSSSSTQARRASRRAWRKSTSGMAGLLPPGQRRGTRFVFIGLAAPEAALVGRLGFPPQVVDRSGQSRRQDGQGLALAAPPGLPLLPALGPLAAAQEQAGGLAEGPAQLRVADLLPARAYHLAVGLVG